MSPLWTAADAAAATGGSNTADWLATGVSIDSRSLAAGDLFVALRGPNHDGHDFVAAALERGAAAAMVDREIAGLSPAAPLLRVTDTLAGLAALGAAGRNRSGARIVAVTGSVGKTGTKEALRLALGSFRPDLCLGRRAQQSLGRAAVARPPAAGCRLRRLRARHEPSRRDRRADAAGAAAYRGRSRRSSRRISASSPRSRRSPTQRRKSFSGWSRAASRSSTATTRIMRGWRRQRSAPGPPKSSALAAHPEADARLLDCVLDSERQHGRGDGFRARPCGFACRFPGGIGSSTRSPCSRPRRPPAQMSGAQPRRWPGFEALPGRGRRRELAWRGGTLTLIDESYNASPAAMRAALAVLAATEPASGGRRVAVLGDMLELGDSSERLHRELAEPLAAAKVDRVFLSARRWRRSIGPCPRQARRVVAIGRGGYPCLLRFLEPGDVVTVKGSRGVRVSRIVERLRAESDRPETVRDVTRCCTRCFIRLPTSSSSSTCSATSPSAREGRSSPRC